MFLFKLQAYFGSLIKLCNENAKCLSGKGVPYPLFITINYY